MAKAGRKYPLVIYTRMLDRWRPPLFLIGLATLALAWWLRADAYTRLAEPWKWLAMAGAGGLCVLAALLMLLFRRAAYVRPYRDHLLVATPFLRLKISYRRIRRTSTTAMSVLFPPARMGLLKRDTLSPLLPLTAVVLELNALPMPRPALRLFLSPFFFKEKDATPHLVLLVEKWMAFSAEMESMRAQGNGPEAPAPGRPASLLSQLPRR